MLDDAKCTLQPGCLAGFEVLRFVNQFAKLIAQVELVKEDVARVVALMVALSQSLWALSPAFFAVLLSTAGTGEARLGSGTGLYFLAVMALQLAAVACALAGRRARS